VRSRIDDLACSPMRYSLTWLSYKRIVRIDIKADPNISKIMPGAQWSDGISQSMKFLCFLDTVDAACVTGEMEYAIEVKNFSMHG
jgi:hypothetical protein